MIIDSSAIVQILLEESGWERLAQFINANDPILLAAVNLVELYIVMESKKSRALLKDVDEYLGTAALQIVSFTLGQALIARDAFQTYGRGSGSKARLNFGDCFAYALAKEAGEPLLFVGNDFVHTDITPGSRPANPTNP